MVTKATAKTGSTELMQDSKEVSTPIYIPYYYRPPITLKTWEPQVKTSWELTGDTLEKLRETYPNREFYFIIGSDNWERFERWYQSERIIKENQLLIYPRPGFPVKEEELPETVRLVHSPVFEISSTFIREALSAGKDIRYFLHPRVWEAIKKDNIRL